MAHPRRRTGQKHREPQRSHFRDRTEAGYALAERLGTYQGRPDTVVVGLVPGIAVAAAVAHALHLPLDVIVTSSLRVPGARRMTMGAVAEDGDAQLNQAVIWGVGASRAQVEAEIARQASVLLDGRRRLRGGCPLTLPPRATVILAVDGLTSGTTAMAAIRALRARGVRRLALAAPVAPPATVDRVSDMVDELVVLETPLAFRGVSPFYGNFRPESEAEVRELLAANRPSRLSTRFAGNGVSHGPKS
jgi:putative phosphoribosyl transferase